MSEKSENWFKNICRTIPLDARIETIIDMELDIMLMDNHYEIAKKLTPLIMEKIQ